MVALNAEASRRALAAGAQAATDVTGFGLSGTSIPGPESGIAAEIAAADVPACRGRTISWPAARASRAERRGTSPMPRVHVFDAGVGEPLRRLMCDPVTSGGLLVALPEERASTSRGRCRPDWRAIRSILVYSRVLGAAGAGAPTGLQSWEAVAAPRWEGSTPSPLRDLNMSLDSEDSPSPADARGLRALPSVDRLAVALARASSPNAAPSCSPATRATIDLVARARTRLRPSLRRVLNATGVIIHTNLGRAPLAPGGAAAVARTAAGYSNLELDLSAGQRGSRHDHVERLLCELTGAETAMAVNNGAAAVLLAAAALADGGRDLIVSRGQLIEIGGGFRIPDVVAQAGGRLVEVGTTNRTRL